MYIDSKHTFVIIAVIQHQHIQVRRIPPPQDDICTCISPFNPLKVFWAPELKSLRTLTLHLCQSQACHHNRCLATLLQVVFATALHTLHYVNQPAPTFEQPWHNYNPLLDITKSRMKLQQHMKHCCNHTISSPLNQASRNFWQLGAFGDLKSVQIQQVLQSSSPGPVPKFCHPPHKHPCTGQGTESQSRPHLPSPWLAKLFQDPPMQCKLSPVQTSHNQRSLSICQSLSLHTNCWSKISWLGGNVFLSLITLQCSEPD